ncbi:hypothetical protein AgCh_039613 [Apium graveolens]
MSRITVIPMLEPQCRPRSEQSLVRWETLQLHDIDALAKMVDRALNVLYPVKSLSQFADRMLLQSPLILLAERVVEEEGGLEFLAAAQSKLFLLLVRSMTGGFVHDVPSAGPSSAGANSLHP